MNGIFMIIGILLGVVIYRLGRWEGEKGRVILPTRRKKADVATQTLLAQIEGYDGKGGRE